MARDHRKLRVFVLADALAKEVYGATSRFPSAERFGLQGQLRRAAVSAACNIVEGSARRSTRDYQSFLNIASGSAAEARYLIELASALQLLTDERGRPLVERYTELMASLRR